jgi:hypothetical protein
MEATFSSETSSDFQLTTGRYIPEDIYIFNTFIRSENFRFM